MACSSDVVILMELNPLPSLPCFCRPPLIALGLVAQANLLYMTVHLLQHPALCSFSSIVMGSLLPYGPPDMVPEPPVTSLLYLRISRTIS